MAGEWFRAYKPTVFVGILRDDPTPGMPTYGMPGLDTILREAGVLDTLGPLLDYHTEREPLHVTLRDLGYTDPTTTPRILALETIAVQVDGGLNEIPRGTCALAVGRAIYSPGINTPAVLSGAPDVLATSVIHALERYLTRHVAVRIYGHVQSVAGAGIGDAGDNQNWPDEPFVLLDGFATGPTRRGDSENAQFVLHVSHFLAALSFTSTLSGQVAAGSATPASFAPGNWFGLLSGLGLPMTPYGAVAAVMAGAKPLYVDFWGYNVPDSPASLPQMGVKGFLDNLASQDLFAWQIFTSGLLGGAVCDQRTPESLKNDRSRAALGRIEPIWPVWSALTPAQNAAAAATSVWGAIDLALTGVRAARSSAADRSDLIANTPFAYEAAGYRYGMPMGFYLSDHNGLNTGDPSRAFASDIVSASFEQLAPSSIWDLLTGVYPARYQMALAPMADRAVMIPAAPVLDGVWQSIYASEIFGWDDDIQTPVPVRGVLLVADRASGTGALRAGYKPIEAGFDSCEPGAFITREMPAWLITTFSNPGAIGGPTQLNVRNAAGAPWRTAPGALAAIGGVAVGVALGRFSAQEQTTANRIARSMWQQERLRYRSVSITGRFRVDIGPGSHVNVELPSDRFVTAALSAHRDTIMRGMVLRVTHSIDAQGENATTAFQIGFVRTEGELQPGQPLYGNIPPIWSTAVYGTPWCDMVSMRLSLGGDATLAST